MVVQYLLWSFLIGNLRDVLQFRLAAFRLFHCGSALWISLLGTLFLNLRGSSNVDVHGYLVY